MSTRGIHANMQTEIAKGAVDCALICELVFDSSPLQVWSGIGTLAWDSKNWLGVGDMGSVSIVEETIEIEAKKIELTFNGISSEMISTTFNVDYQGRTANLWLALLSDGSVIDNPVKIFSGIMDVMTIDEGPETSIVSVSVESCMVDLLKAKEWRYTHEDQQVDYPGDNGLEYVIDLQNKEMRWAPS